MFEDAIKLSLLSEEIDGVNGATEFFLLDEMIKTLEDHFHQNILKRTIQSIRDAVGEIDQKRIEQPGSPNLDLDPVDRPYQQAWRYTASW